MSGQPSPVISRVTALLLAFTALSLLAASPLRAQANFVETFDDLGSTDLSRPGPRALATRGWTFRNQSQPRATPAFFAGVLPAVNPMYFGPHSGAGYLAANEWCTDTPGVLSNWAILPVVPDQQTGDVLNLWVRSLSGTGQLEVRYSPTGGTSTGTSVGDVGDFTTVLIDINPAPGSGWTNFTATVPGAGRIALRHRGVTQLGGYDPYIGIDTLSIGPPPPPPCNLPPIPQPGETATWTAASSPYRICQNLAIPAGATVVVEPGVVVNFDYSRQLAVAGTLNVQGTSGSPVVFAAPHVFPNPLVVGGGVLDADFAEFHLVLKIASGCELLLSDCAFGSDGMIISESLMSVRPYVVLQRCAFSSSNVVLADCLAVLRENTFTDTYAWLLRTYADVTAPNTFVGQPLRITREESIQGLYVDGVHGSNCNESGLSLDGGVFHVGPATVLEGNIYPLELRGGLTPDSAVPLTGNAHNAINVADGGFAGRGQWSNLGLPYRLTEGTSQSPGGHLTVAPGVVIEAAHPDAGMWFVSTRQGVFDGLPDAPITFRGLDGQPWGGLLYHVNSTTGCRLEYCIIENAQRGVISTDNHLYVDNCIFASNQIGANTNTFGSIHFRKTRLIDNSVGVESTDLGSLVLDSPAQPNAFEGNGAAFDAFEFGSGGNARNCWWGHPTGPRAPGNPDGQGDPIIGNGAPNVAYEPYLTQPPEFGNTPPVVRMVNPGYLLDQGVKYVVRWEVSSDDPVVSQRIEFSPDGHYPSRFSVLVDNIPGDARTWEITVPNPGFAVTNQPQFLRVVAADGSGQEGWDQAAVQVPSGRIEGTLTITSDDWDGRTFIGGTPVGALVQWSGKVNYGQINPMILLESDDASILGFGSGSFFGEFPLVSTDRARFAIQVTNNSNDVAWFYADGYFSIRHDPRMGLEPPSVAIQSPLDGEAFEGGDMVPITWTASAPEGLRSFDIQASYDRGRTWHPVVRDLPATATSYNWRLPASAGIDEVRIRVVVRDQRFQNSSSHGPSGGDLAIAVTPGEGGGCAADFNDDGTVNSTDVSDFVNQWFVDQAEGSLITDWDGNGVVNSTDVSTFINRWFEDAAAGCG